MPGHLHGSKRRSREDGVAALPQPLLWRLLWLLVLGKEALFLTRTTDGPWSAVWRAWRRLVCRQSPGGVLP